MAFQNASTEKNLLYQLLTTGGDLRARHSDQHLYSKSLGGKGKMIKFKVTLHYIANSNYSDYV